jgi:Beta-galactosidase
MSCWSIRGPIFINLVLAIALLAIALLVARFQLFSLGAFAYGQMEINGVYDLTQFNNKIPSSITNNPYVDGVSIRVTGWSTVEPQEGSFNWTALDYMISQVSSPNPTKKIAITIPAGYTTPSWVYAAGAHKYSWVWDRQWGPKLCSLVKMPLPWDPVFQEKWAEFVQAFGARYGSNLLITNIKLTGPNNGPDPELWLPHKGSVGIGTGSVTCSDGTGFQCCSYDNDQDWINVGYTRTKMESAMLWDMAQFRTAFPTIPITLETGPCSMPAIDSNGNFFSTPRNCGDLQGVWDIANYGINIYARHGFILQNDGLEADQSKMLAAFWSTMQSDVPYVDIGFQFARPVGTNGFSSITQTGINYGAQYIEFYQSDLTNSANATEVESAHSQLLMAH